MVPLPFGHSGGSVSGAAAAASTPQWHGSYTTAAATSGGGAPGGGSSRGLISAALERAFHEHDPHGTGRLAGAWELRAGGQAAGHRTTPPPSPPRRCAQLCAPGRRIALCHVARHGMALHG